MKRIFAIFLCLTLLSGCSTKGNSGVGSAGESGSAGTKTETAETALLTGTVAALYEEAFLLTGEETGKLNVLPYCGAQLQRGNKVEAVYSGYTLTTYPGQPTDVTEVTVTQDGTDLLGLYLAVLGELYENDPGLNGDISLVAFDFSALNNLNAGEKQALGYLFAGELGLQYIFGTFPELEEQGYITDLYFKDGILLSISTEDTEADGYFSFSAQKWRSGLGAIGMNDCSATLSGREWKYKTGGFWIS